MDNNLRKLKIYKKCRMRTWDTTSVPEIRIQGKWLEKLGFKQGDDINVLQQPNKLTITLKEKNKTDIQRAGRAV